MFCSKCGKEQQDDARFCSSCGAENKSAPSVSQGDAQGGITQPASNAAPDIPSPASGTPKPKKKTGLIAGIIAAVVVVAAVLVFVFVNPFAKDPLKDVKVGDVIHLGQVSFTASGGDQFKDDIGWRVLAVETDRVLVISEDIIDLRPYNTELTNITWEQSTLRTWLNGDFFDGLPKVMRDRAQTIQVVNSNNSDYGTAGGKNTNDKVFLLSLDEAQKYFLSDNDLQTGYSLTPGTIKSFNAKHSGDIEEYVRHYYGDGAYPWWLRSPGYSPSDAALVYGGVIDSGGGNVGGKIGGVRPALWLSR